MSKNKGPDRRILHSFSYPIYQLKAIGSNILLVTGGGGNSKTGVPNRIDVIYMNRPAYTTRDQNVDEALIPSHVSVIGGANTKREAIMHMATVFQSPGAVCVLALEGFTIQEYFLYSSALESADFRHENFIDQESTISSTGLDCHYQHQKTPSFSSSSSGDGKPSSISTTTKRRPSKDKEVNNEKSTKKFSDTCSEKTHLPWTCKTLRSVSITPTSALLERRRMDSCSSTGSVSSVSALIDDELNCITSGGPGGSWCAVGTAHGGVALIDRYSLIEARSDVAMSPVSNGNSSYAFSFDDDAEDSFFPLQPFCTLLDVSGGRRAPVSDVALSETTFNQSPDFAFSKTGKDIVPTTPLLATISGRPMGSLLCIWRLPNYRSLGGGGGSNKTPKCVKFADIEGELSPGEVASSPVLHAEVKIQNSPIPANPKAAGKRSGRSENGTRFRHCEFLRWIHKVDPPSVSPSDTELFTFLVTTEQPVSPTTRSVCHLSVWHVPMPTAESIDAASQKPHQPVLDLERFASVSLPQGEIPACIAVHPSRNRGIIGLGTMEGSVDVFMISLKKRSLVRVYSMPRAHPIFVTSLSFLPPRNRGQTASAENPPASSHLLPPHYELVSSSADRVIRWHRGPAMAHVASISAGIKTNQSPSPRSIIMFTVFLLLPLIFSTLDALLSFVGVHD